MSQLTEAGRSTRFWGEREEENHRWRQGLFFVSSEVREEGNGGQPCKLRKKVAAR